MPDTTSREQFARMRLEPLNQLASLKLKQAGVGTSPTALPVFALMDWGLSVNKAYAGGRLARELLRLRLMGDQQAAVAYLLENLPGGLPQLNRKLLGLSPRGAALALLEVLDMRLRADPRNPYPSK